MDSNDRITGVAEPPAGTRRTATTAENDDFARPLVPAPESLRFEPIRRNFQARLNYDPVEADVFIEILDPTTGDVIRRLPAESKSQSRIRELGTLIDRFA
jgi:hypothetical protein